MDPIEFRAEDEYTARARGPRRGRAAVLFPTGAPTPMLRTLERGSLVIVLSLLVALGAWLGSSDSRLDRTIRDQGDRIEETEKQVDLHEKVIVDHTVSIESNREAIERNSVAIESTRDGIDGLETAVSVAEDAGSQGFVIERTGGSDGEVTVSVSTFEGTPACSRATRAARSTSIAGGAGNAGRPCCPESASHANRSRREAVATDCTRKAS